MTVQAQRRGGGYLDRPAPSGLAAVAEIILDKGLVIDLYVRVSLVRIELLTIDARIVIASVDTYLRFAEATNRLDLTQTGDAKGLPEFFGDMEEDGASRKTKGALQGAKDSVSELFSSSEDDDEDDDDVKEEKKKTRTPARRR